MRKTESGTKEQRWLAPRFLTVRVSAPSLEEIWEEKCIVHVFIPLDISPVFFRLIRCENHKYIPLEAKLNAVGVLFEFCKLI